jgi:hypothetical protein
MEDFVDEETNEVTSVERNEVVCGKGTLLNAINISLLEENDIKTVKVSNVPLLGTQDKNLNLWEVVLKVHSKKGDSKKSYYVTADCPAASESFISEYFEVNIEATFELVKVNKLEYGKVIKIYDLEVEQFGEGVSAKWYRCQIYSMIDDDDDGSNRSAGDKNVLVQATTFENAIKAIKLAMNRSEYESIYNTFKLLQELKIVDVFIPDENVSFYSNGEL